MGFALAEEFANRGATVHLISGPVNIEKHHSEISITRIPPHEMHQACLGAFANSHIIIMAAAVADYTPEIKKSKKLKRKVRTDRQFEKNN